MIELQSVRKRFGPVIALDDVTVSVRAGRVTALVGPNGSGKSTLVKILLGLTRADAGDVRVDGVPIDAAGVYRRRIGYMPQSARFPAQLTAHDVLALLRALRPGDAVDTTLITELGLEAIADRALGTLSGGTVQKLNAAIAFLFSPPVLVLDEPSSGLDPLANDRLKVAIRAARARGASVVITSHLLAELATIADDVVFLCDGAVRFAGPVEELVAQTGGRGLEDAVTTLMHRAHLRRVG